jgi:hypothetical protein
VLTIGRRARPGATLVELLVALAVASIALALISAISLRQQRIVADLSDAAATQSQLGDALSVLSVDLASVSSSGGDIREARDTSLEIRATIASTISCDTLAGRLVLAPPSGDASSYGSVLQPIETGDTAWLLTPTDTAEDWRPYRIGDVASTAPGDCASSGPRLAGAALTSARVSVVLDGFAAAYRLGVPIRVTRPARYSLYRGSDGQWYLGLRDWSNTNGRFNGIQPVSGPFLSPASHGLVFQFADTAGLKLSTPVADTKTIALVRIDLRSETRAPVRILSTRYARRDESDGAWILLRNRR